MPPFVKAQSFCVSRDGPKVIRCLLGLALKFVRKRQRCLRYKTVREIVMVHFFVTNNGKTSADKSLPDSGKQLMCTNYKRTKALSLRIIVRIVHLSFRFPNTKFQHERLCVNVFGFLTLLTVVKEECNACWAGVKVWRGRPGAPGACNTTPPSWFVRGGRVWSSCLGKRLGNWSWSVSGCWNENSPPSWKQVSGEIPMSFWKLRSAPKLNPSAQPKKEFYINNDQSQSLNVFYRF